VTRVILASFQLGLEKDCAVAQKAHRPQKGVCSGPRRREFPIRRALGGKYLHRPDTGGYFVSAPTGRIIEPLASCSEKGGFFGGVKHE